MLQNIKIFFFTIFRSIMFHKPGFLAVLHTHQSGSPKRSYKSLTIQKYSPKLIVPYANGRYPCLLQLAEAWTLDLKRHILYQYIHRAIPPNFAISSFPTANFLLSMNSASRFLLNATNSNKGKNHKGQEQKIL